MLTPRPHLAPLTRYDHTLYWFEQKAQAELRRAAREGPSTLSGARERIAKEFEFDNWRSLDQFCVRAIKFLDRNTIQLRRYLKIEHEEVWDYIADTKQLAKWHIPTTWDLRVGGRFEFRNAWSGYISELEAGNYIQFTADQGGYTRFSVEPYKEETLFTLTDYMGPEVTIANELIRAGTPEENQPGGIGTHWHGVMSGWHAGADTLSALVVGESASINYDHLDSIYALLLREYFR